MDTDVYVGVTRSMNTRSVLRAPGAGTYAVTFADGFVKTVTLSAGASLFYPPSASVARVVPTVPPVSPPPPPPPPPAVVVSPPPPPPAAPAEVQVAYSVDDVFVGVLKSNNTKRRVRTPYGPPAARTYTVTLADGFVTDVEVKAGASLYVPQSAVVRGSTAQPVPVVPVSPPVAADDLPPLATALGPDDYAVFVDLADEGEDPEPRQVRVPVRVLADAIKPLIPGKNGRDGRDGFDGQDGQDGADGADGVDGQNEAPEFEGENKDAVTVPAGAAVTIHGSGVGVRLADAATAGREAVGLAVASTDVGFSATVRTGGLMTLADWTGATGAATLTPRAPYFLSPTAGLLTVTPPTTAGHRVQQVGVAVTADTMALQVFPPILL